MPPLGPDTPRVCERFSTATQSTIPFVSRDNMTFHIERAKLERAAEFAPPSSVHSSPTEPVRLDDDSVTLELLFRFVYCEVYINLDAESFLVVAELAEAAEKYMVYSAMTVCRLYMKNKSKEQPTIVMKYAARYNYKDILDVVAPYTVGRAVPVMKQILPESYLLPWFTFNSEYQEVARLAVTRRIEQDSCHFDEAGDWYPCMQVEVEDGDPPWVLDYQRKIALALSVTGGRGLLDLDRIFTRELAGDLKCGGCAGAFHAWKYAVATDVSRIAPFTTFF